MDWSFFIMLTRVKTIQQGADGSQVAIFHSTLHNRHVVWKTSHGGEADVYRRIHEAHGHPNILRRLDLDDQALAIQPPAHEDEILQSMTLEYCEAGDMLDWLNQHNGHIPPQQCLAYFHQIVSAVAFLHTEVGVSHGDLSFENVGMWRYNHAKLIDFGFSARLHSPLRRKAGKIHFMAPEMFGETPWLPGPADVWALGLMLFSLLTKVYLLDDGPCASQDEDVATALRDYGVRGVLWWSPARWQDKIPPCCVDLLDSMLRWDPSHRIGITRVVECVAALVDRYQAPPVQSRLPMSFAAKKRKAAIKWKREHRIHVYCSTRRCCSRNGHA